MGHSAKLHKRVKKTAKQKDSPPSAVVQTAKRRAGLKSKAKAKTSGERVLDGADYVTLLLGGRRKAAEEARKLPS